jgi:serine-type D-Ala-D-Ala carboxypeptidase (penicillin-binding protein 5/6)
VTKRAGVAKIPVAAVPLITVQDELPRAGLRVSAPAGILVDGDTGAVLWAKRAHMRRPIASTTKIMTAIVAMSLLRPHDRVVVAREATRVAPQKEGLRVGEKLQAWKLFYGLLLVSGNDTAVALAVAAGGTKPHFIALMNEKARKLGLRDTQYRSPSGLIDVGNYSSAWDLAALTRYALWNARFRAIVRTRQKLVSWPAPTHAKLYVNHNKLLRWYPGADGVKTGWTTKAGHCLVASATRHGVHLIAVVLDAPNHYGDVIKLLNYGFKSHG